MESYHIEVIAVIVFVVVFFGTILVLASKD